jgi:hypothetical protein
MPCSRDDSGNTNRDDGFRLDTRTTETSEHRIMSNDDPQPSKREQNAMRLAAIEARLAERRDRFEVSTLAAGIVVAVVAGTTVVCTLLMMTMAVHEVATKIGQWEGPQLINDLAVALAVGLAEALVEAIEQLAAKTACAVAKVTLSAATWATGNPTLAPFWLMLPTP